jgi:hypothetical protein
LFLQGTSAEQDNRFSDKEKKLLKQMRFADHLSKRVSYINYLHSKINYTILSLFFPNILIFFIRIKDKLFEFQQGHSVKECTYFLGGHAKGENRRAKALDNTANHRFAWYGG